jgi:hypothetical protein
MACTMLLSSIHISCHCQQHYHLVTIHHDHHWHHRYVKVESYADIYECCVSLMPLVRETYIHLIPDKRWGREFLSSFNLVLMVKLSRLKQLTLTIIVNKVKGWRKSVSGHPKNNHETDSACQFQTLCSVSSTVSSGTTRHDKQCRIYSLSCISHHNLVEGYIMQYEVGVYSAAALLF